MMARASNWWKTYLTVGAEPVDLPEPRGPRKVKLAQEAFRGVERRKTARQPMQRKPAVLTEGG